MSQNSHDFMRVRSPSLPHNAFGDISVRKAMVAASALGAAIVIGLFVTAPEDSFSRQAFKQAVNFMEDLAQPRTVEALAPTKTKTPTTHP